MSKFTITNFESRYRNNLHIIWALLRLISARNHFHFLNIFCVCSTYCKITILCAENWFKFPLNYLLLSNPYTAQHLDFILLSTLHLVNSRANLNLVHNKERRCTTKIYNEPKEAKYCYQMQTTYLHYNTLIFKFRVKTTKSGYSITSQLLFSISLVTLLLCNNGNLVFIWKWMSLFFYVSGIWCTYNV